MRDNTEIINQTNILIVDDLQSNLILLEKILQPTGCNLIMAKSGDEALQKIANHDIALALIDIHMPEMNGFDLAELVQKKAGSKLIPIIFITAHTSDQSEIEKYFSKGVVDFIAKPFNYHILLSAFAKDANFNAKCSNGYACERVKDIQSGAGKEIILRKPACRNIRNGRFG